LPAKAAFPIVVSAPEKIKFILVRLSQRAKDRLPILISVDGKLSVSSDIQLINALLPMVNKPSLNEIVIRELHSEKANAPIESIVSGSVSEAIPVSASA
jgi:hypothetical protein